MIVLSVPSHLSERWPNMRSTYNPSCITVYKAFCDSGVLGRFWQAPGHLLCTGCDPMHSLIQKVQAGIIVQIKMAQNIQAE